MNEAKVYQQIPRLSDSILRELIDVSVADAYESMDRTGLFDIGIGPVCTGLRICGQAITCLNYPGDNLAIHIALHLAHPGDILVVTSTIKPGFGCWGDLATVCAQARGIGGVVTDGYVRDVASIRAARFPVWAVGFNARGAVKHDVAGLNVQIACGGQLINPGDIILGDDDGVAVIPLESVDEVFRRARARRSKEERICELLRKGVSTYDVFELGLVPGGDQTQWNAGAFRVSVWDG